MKNKIILDCDTCIYHQKFKKREDEISNEGCSHYDWAGYVIKDKKTGLKNACAGLGHSIVHYR